MDAKIKIFVLFIIFSQQSCQSQVPSQPQAEEPQVTASTDNYIQTAPEASLQVGAERLDLLLPMVQNKRLGLVVNHTSQLGDTHLVDTLSKRGIDIRAIFAPEHGFRGKADAGEQVVDGKDSSTGIPIISLYGKHKKPRAENLQDIDLLVFDIQDVGARFYTYISTLHYVMEAAAEHGITVLVLDRPNPNGHFVDGPILDPDYSSFVGMHPVPVVHGMTVGEYARMINGEGWLANGMEAELLVLRCENYTHDTPYDLPIPPSPNLPNMRSIYLYPSLCLFEGTVFSVGRGTDLQFQIYGHPDFNIGSFQFTPVSSPGAKYPKHENSTCFGANLTRQSPSSIREEAQLNLFFLLQAYEHFGDKEHFFLENRFFDTLAGGSTLRGQIEAGMTSTEIKASWQAGLEGFKQMRAQYLLYE